MNAPSARVLVFAPNWLGDAVMALPALHAVRRHFPSAALAVGSRSHLSSLFMMIAGVNEVVSLERAARLGGLLAARRDARRLRGRFDVAILLPNSFRAAWTARRAGIAERWGYASDSRAHLLTRAVPRQRGGHQVEYYQRLVEGLGIETCFDLGTSDRAVRPSDFGLQSPDPGLIKIPAGARDWARDTLAAHGWKPGDLLVGMAPGAAYGTAKQWPPDRFAQLAVHVGQEGHAVQVGQVGALGQTAIGRARTVLVGSGRDRAACDEVARIASLAIAPRAHSGLPVDSPRDAPLAQGTRPDFVVNLAGRTDLQQLAAVIAECSCFVSNDSGAMHLAAALGVPVVAIFGSTNEHETAPVSWGSDRTRHAVITTDTWCRPCMLRECPLDHACMTGIDVARVKDDVVQVLRAGESYGPTSPGKQVARTSVASEPRERSGAPGAPASEHAGGSGGAKPPGKR